ncbi:hypothetical protein F0L68_15750 [Solihabitans fulvus]|uniref:Uncharacterized protein n=1 Tax=Solihabitans fulvus TaxID=1892852 RepID=A0A5B2XFK8_9PSEU|nr:hypothetical protein [Solihabitans fulvus]KAA2261700.1 hypothetical protein F0L68_15750 [Solihabitans fulvus]
MQRVWIAAARAALDRVEETAPNAEAGKQTDVDGDVTPELESNEVESAPFVERRLESVTMQAPANGVGVEEPKPVIRQAPIPAMVFQEPGRTA